ncbi:MAG: C25 family cysteine peptidase, partial [Pirellulales bacterium]
MSRGSMRILLALTLAVLIGGPAAAELHPSPAAEVMVICPAGLNEALAPWVAHRRAGGYRVAVSHAVDDANTIRRTIRAAAADAARRGGRLEAVLLVGDVAADDQPNPLAVPTHLAEAKINIRWGSEPHIATDNWYADLDDDDVPDVAIGRFAVDSAAELRQVIAKTIAYEQQPDFGMWRRRLHFVAGVGGFGKLADGVLESGTRYFLTGGIPAAYRSTMTYANWRSPYCPDPHRFRETTLARLNDGCLFWVYIGHGHKQHLDVMRTPAGGFPILSNQDVPHIAPARGAPVALFLSCYAGAFDQPEDCLAEKMLRHESGPVAVIAGSRVTMPYAMAVMGSTMLEECFD